MRRVTHFIYRNGGITVTQIDTLADTLVSIGRRMCEGGFIIGHDAFWSDGSRDVVINLEDVSVVIIASGGNGGAGED